MGHKERRAVYIHEDGEHSLMGATMYRIYESPADLGRIRQNVRMSTPPVSPVAALLAGRGGAIFGLFFLYFLNPVILRFFLLESELETKPSPPPPPQTVTITIAYKLTSILLLKFIAEPCYTTTSSENVSQTTIENQKCT